MFLSRIRRFPGVEQPPHQSLGLAAPSPLHREPMPADPLQIPEPEHTPPANARLALSEAFAPTRPQTDARRFVGREAQLARVRRALAEERAHVVLHGEGGWGKTSLVNMVAEAARATGVMVARYACSAEDDFDSILRGLARSLPASFLLMPPPAAAGGEEAAEGCESALPPGRLRPHDLSRLLPRLTGQELILVVDEFDRVPGEETRTRLADTIKLASDMRLALSFVVVGVAEDLEALLGRHPSIHRQVIGVRLPLLSEDEVEDIIERGAGEAGVTFPAPVRSRIRSVARGVPYVAQLLALRAGQAALERGVRKVTIGDLDAALASAIEETHPRVVELYGALVEGGRNRAMAALLRAVATSPQDAFGRFRAEGAEEEPWIGGTQVDPDLWSRLIETGTVRAARGGTAEMFVFSDAALHQYLLMRAGRGNAGAAVQQP